MDQETNDFITTLTDIDIDVWIGGYNTCPSCGSGGYAWSDDSDWQFENWSVDEPDRFGFKDYVILTNTGKWWDWMDGKDGYGYICQFTGDQYLIIPIAFLKNNFREA